MNTSAVDLRALLRQFHPSQTTKFATNFNCQPIRQAANSPILIDHNAQPFGNSWRQNLLCILLLGVQPLVSHLGVDYQEDPLGRLASISDCIG